METPDPPNDTPGALKQVVLTPHDIPWSLREGDFLLCTIWNIFLNFFQAFFCKSKINSSDQLGWLVGCFASGHEVVLLMNL